RGRGRLSRQAPRRPPVPSPGSLPAAPGHAGEPAPQAGEAEPSAPACTRRGARLGRVMSQHQRLLIIDFGSQVTQLIARRLRELKVYCEIHPYQRVDDAFLRDFAPKAVILSGGPDSVTRP